MTGIFRAASENINGFSVQQSRSGTASVKVPLSLPYTLDILDLKGAVVTSRQENSNGEVSINGLKPGVYLFRLRAGGQEILRNTVIY